MTHIMDTEELNQQLVDAVENRRFDSNYNGGNYEQVRYTVAALLPAIRKVILQQVTEGKIQENRHHLEDAMKAPDSPLRTLVMKEFQDRIKELQALQTKEENK